MLHDVVIRLTAWYALAFTVLSLITAGAFYAFLVSSFHARTDAGLLAEAREISSIYATNGDAAVQEDVTRESLSEGIDSMFVRILDASGRTLAATDLRTWKNFGLDQLPLTLREGDTFRRTLSDTQSERRARTLTLGLGGGAVLQMGDALDQDDRVMEDIREMAAVALPAMVVLAGLGGYFMARRALSGVEAVTNTAHAIIRGDMTRRVPVAGRGDEIDRLAATFNNMLDRIQALVQGMREVNDSIAHDLRSPITRMRAAAELALSSDTPNGAAQTLASDTVEECDRLLGIINTMLDISETEAGVAKFNMETLDLGKLVREGCELFSVAMEDKDQELAVNIPDHPCLVKGDLRWLQRTLANILDNAVKYTPPGGRVSVAVRADETRVITVVEDSGAGIEPHDLPHIFERFYRADTSRTEKGSGLGLSLAHAVVKAHGGNIEADSEAGAGSRFVITLPRDDAQA